MTALYTDSDGHDGTLDLSALANPALLDPTPPPGASTPAVAVTLRRPVSMTSHGLRIGLGAQHLGAIATIIRDSTGNGRDLVDILVGITRGERQARARDVIDACKILLEYAFGKPVATTELTGPGGGPLQVVTRDLGNLSDEQLEMLVDLRNRLLAAQEQEQAP